MRRWCQRNRLCVLHPKSLQTRSHKIVVDFSLPSFSIQLRATPMDLFNADLSALTIADIEDFLVISGPEEQRPAEGVKLDYKLNESADLSDTVAAFANTSGGLLFIGVDSKRQRRNVPTAIPGAAFTGGDVKARLIGKIMSQVTPRPDVDLGVARVSAHSTNAAAVVRVREGVFPPYQFSLGDKVRIPMRFQDTNRQAALRDIEQLFGKRASFTETPEDRTRKFLTTPLNPAFMADSKADSGELGRGYHTWALRPRAPTRLRLDRTFDRTFGELISAHFVDTGVGQFWPPIVTGQTHIVRWQSGISGDRGIPLKIVRHFECTSEGELRFSERIDRHEEGQPESVSDLFIGSLRFLNLAQSFYRRLNQFGSLSVLHYIDCRQPIELLPTFPDARGIYHSTNAILLAQTSSAHARGASLKVQELENIETGSQQELVCDFMLGHLRQLCQASVDYESLMRTVNGCQLNTTCFFV